jgi:membrane-associated phospholipid phosphatase
VAKSVKAPVAAWLACAGALILLALVAYGVDAAQRLDARLLVALTTTEGSSLDVLANGVVHLGDPLPLLALLALACGIALWRGRPLDAAAAIAVVAGANLTTQVLKVVLAHPRFQSVLGTDQVGAIAFPSGHATAATSIAIAFAFVAPPNLRPAFVTAGVFLAAAVCCAVVVLAWHYPSDVLGGILVASGWGFAVLAVLQAAGAGPSRQTQVARPSAISLK